MDYFWGSVKLMLFTYALAAVISLAMAWIMRLIFVGIRKQKNRADAKNSATAETRTGPRDAAPNGTT